MGLAAAHSTSVVVIERDAAVGQLVICVLAENDLHVVHHRSFDTARAWLAATSTPPSLLLVNDRMTGGRIEQFLIDYRRLPGEHAPVVLFTTNPRA